MEGKQNNHHGSKKNGDRSHRGDDPEWSSCSDIFVHKERLCGGGTAANRVDPHRMVHHHGVLWVEGATGQVGVHLGKQGHSYYSSPYNARGMQSFKTTSNRQGLVKRSGLQDLGG